MRRTTLLTALIFTLIHSTNLLAQPDTLWTKTLGFAGSEYFTSVNKTDDGGFILGGHTSSFFNDSTVYWLARLDSEGDTLWNKLFRAGEHYDNQQALQTADGGFAIAGDGDPWLIKTDADGNKQWQQAASTLGANVNIYWLEETSDQGFIAAGDIEIGYKSRALVVKTDNGGAVVWVNTFGGEHDAVGLAVTETSAGQFAMAGAKQHPTGGGLNNGWLLMLSASGDSLWSVVYGDTADGFVKSIQETADDGFILIGRMNLAPHDTSSRNDMYLLKTDASGAIEWTKTFGGANDDEGMTVIQTSDLGYTFIGFGALETDGFTAAWIVHTDANGDTLWTLIPGDPNYYFGLDLVEITEGQYLIVGGRIDWDLGEAFGWVARLGTVVNALDTPLGTPVEFALHPNYPNPFNPGTAIRFDLPEPAELTLVIYDLLGREVARLIDGVMEPGYHQIGWNGRRADGSAVPSGIYIARLHCRYAGQARMASAQYTRSMKMLLLK